MGRDHSDAFVQLTFDGLIAFCFNPDQDGRCEMGMVQVADHNPLLKITRCNPDGSETVLEDRSLGPQDEVSVVAGNPVTPGTSTFTAPGFHRVRDTGDEEDFQWIVDLQHPQEFHGPALKPVLGGGSDTKLRPRIIIPHAIFYTVDKSEPPFFRTTRRGSGPDKELGKITDKGGADIVCDPEGGHVTVTIGQREPIPLRSEIDSVHGYTYLIDISNLCRTSGGPTCPPLQSDFPNYYRALRDDQAIEFDLYPVYPPGDPRGQHPVEQFVDPVSPEFAGFRRNGPPQVCNLIFLSRTDSID